MKVWVMFEGAHNARDAVGVYARLSDAEDDLRRRGYTPIGGNIRGGPDDGADLVEYECQGADEIV